MIKLYNFIYKRKFIKVFASSFHEAEIIAQEIFNELDTLEEQEENEEKD
ncbi:hypothetical protein [Ureibacillus aquaedulcis]|uniref:YqzL-like protein n=1 Tax=Ureibacillus aquaedulcis TaxID=3058421 RepID=A0ABT8GQ52_9BACL|nr:hypothetical protein [Ureibacillus sp. BA0131]MDN4493364.1 hypothetical protein [Ureibacillus sp. BA0131]